MPTAFITGITGQDGSYLAEFLLSKGYRVVGMVRSSSRGSLGCVAHLRDKVQLCQGDLLDQVSLNAAIEKFQPDEVYNLAAQSFVPASWQQPVLTGELTALGVTRVLEAIRNVNPRIKMYQASTCEMFGKAVESPQNERTPFYPRSPYGVAKVYGHYLTINYRESYGLFAVSGIMFNHESPRRGREYVTRKISDGVARIVLGRSKELLLGNLEVARDWGYAGDYVEAMWMMLQAPQPEDFVIGTGEAHTVREFVEEAFRHVGLDWTRYVRIDPQFKRPAEVANHLADPAKARTKLGWKPRVSFPQLVRLMVDADLKLLGAQKE